jgi:hypothetical protein
MKLKAMTAKPHLTHKVRTDGDGQSWPPFA